MRDSSILLDANLLVLLAVGVASPAYIERHKRLRAFERRDFELLVSILSEARTVTVTPNTATEASNLARQINGPASAEISQALGRFLHEADETYVPSLRAATDRSYLRLGLTDAALLSEVFAGHLLLTVDLDLYIEASRQGRKVVNFNHYLEANR